MKLEQNYRSTEVILDLLTLLLKITLDVSRKNLWTDKGTGKKITYFRAIDERDEARFVIEQMQELQTKENAKLGDMACVISY